MSTQLELQLWLGGIIGALGILTNLGLLLCSRFINQVPVKRKNSSYVYSSDDVLSETYQTRAKTACHSLKPAQSLASLNTAGFRGYKCSFLRLSSLLSINVPKSEAPVKDATSQKFRHRRYLQGLLTMASGNLLVSVALLLDCAISELCDWVSVILLRLADIFQAVEVAAVLWIALNRTLSVHSIFRRCGGFRVCRRPEKATRKQRMDEETNACCCRPFREHAFKRSDPCEVSAAKGERRKFCAFKLGHRFYRLLIMMASLLPVLIVGTSNLAYIWQSISRDSEQNRSIISTCISADSKYYTNITSIFLSVGLFLFPVACLMLTNILIYRKVSKRHEYFLSRQTSNTSKKTVTSCASDGPIISTKHTLQPVPIVNVIESSQQDIADLTFDPAHCDTLTRRLSVSSHCLAKAASVYETSSVSSSDIHQAVHCKGRRKSCTDLPSVNFGASESMMLRVLRRQHRRTVWILFVLFVVFLLSQGPRCLTLLVLSAQWEPQLGLCFGPTQLNTTLTIWSRLTAILDPFVYGFWGYRAYRRSLGRWLKAFFKRSSSLDKQTPGQAQTV